MSLRVSSVAEDIKTKIKNCQFAPFGSGFLKQKQTRNCWQDYLDFHCCDKAMITKVDDVPMCKWYQHVYKSLCPVSWVLDWDDHWAEGTFSGNI